MNYGEEDFHLVWGLTTMRISCNYCGMVTGSTVGAKHNRGRIIATLIESFPHFDSCALNKAANEAAEPVQR